MPRPTIMNERMIAIIEESCKLGMKREHCAKRAGIAPSTFYSWIAKGRRGVPKEQLEELDNRLKSKEITEEEHSKRKKNLLRYVEFLDRIEKATANGIAYNLAIIQTAAKTQWHAAAWLLERGPGKYNRTVLMEESDDELIDIEEVNVKDLLRSIEKSNEALKPYLTPVIDD